MKRATKRLRDFIFNDQFRNKIISLSRKGFSFKATLETCPLSMPNSIMTNITAILCSVFPPRNLSLCTNACLRRCSLKSWSQKRMPERQGLLQCKHTVQPSIHSTRYTVLRRGGTGPSNAMSNSRSLLAIDEIEAATDWLRGANGSWSARKSLIRRDLNAATISGSWTLKEESPDLL